MKRVIQAPNAAPTIFPDPDLDMFLAYVRSVWDELKSIAPVWWTHRRETKLVEGFHLALNNDDRLMRHGVGFGHLTIESVEIDEDANGMPRQRGRTDIRFAHASWMGPTLILEFKLLNNQPTLRRKYVTQGVDRFVTGQYAPETDFAVMVGMVQGLAAAEKAALVIYLSRPATRRNVLSKAMNFPTHGDPSFNTPALDFDTLHDRHAHCVAPEIRVGHMLLER